MPLEKIICPQCGGNDLHPFGFRAFKCNFCGAVLKEEEEPVAPAPPPAPAAEKQKSQTHFVAPLSNDFRDTYRRYQDEDDEDPEPGFTFIKTLVGLAIAAVVIFIVLWVLGVD